MACRPHAGPERDYEDIIQSIAVPAAFASLREEGEVVAMAYAVLDGDPVVLQIRGDGCPASRKGVRPAADVGVVHWAQVNQGDGGLPAGREPKCSRTRTLSQPRHGDRTASLSLPAAAARSVTEARRAHVPRMEREIDRDQRAKWSRRCGVADGAPAASSAK